MPILKCQIEKVEVRTMPGESGKPDSTMYLVNLTDKTKPAQFRLSGSMPVYLTQEKWDKLKMTPDEAIDENVTFLLGQVVAGKMGVGFKGSILPGWLNDQQLAALTATPGAPQIVERPAVTEPVKAK